MGGEGKGKKTSSFPNNASLENNILNALRNLHNGQKSLGGFRDIPRKQEEGP